MPIMRPSTWRNCRASHGTWFDGDGTFAPATARVLQDETNELWRDMRVMHGKAPNQIKPVHIVDTEQKRRFFFALIDGEIEG